MREVILDYDFNHVSVNQLRLCHKSVKNNHVK